MLRDGLDQVWSMASGGVELDIPDALEAEISWFVPHVDDFDDDTVLFAQDAAILRPRSAASTLFDPKQSSDASVPVWYMYETVVSASWYQKTGQYSWSSAESESAQVFLAEAPMVLGETQRILADLSRIAVGPAERAELVHVLRTDSKARAHTFAKLGVLEARTSRT